MKTTAKTTYFDGEGRPAMLDCLCLAAEWCADESIATLVVFTGTGEGPHYVARELLVKDRYRNLRCVAVTPPYGRPYKVNPADPNSPVVRSGLNPALLDELEQLGVKVVSAHLPFKEIHAGQARTSEWARVAEAFGVLGGGFALCIQAVLVACDAGMVAHGERVVVASADTAFVVVACRTESFLSPTEGLLVEHIICRPRRYDVSKRYHETIAPAQVAAPPAQPQLPAEPKLLEADTTRSAPKVDGPRKPAAKAKVRERTKSASTKARPKARTK
jgi:uncharacterized protein